MLSFKIIDTYSNSVKTNEILDRRISMWEQPFTHSSFTIYKTKVNDVSESSTKNHHHHVKE